MSGVSLACDFDSHGSASGAGAGAGAPRKVTFVFSGGGSPPPSKAAGVRPVRKAVLVAGSRTPAHQRACAVWRAQHRTRRLHENAWSWRDALQAQQTLLAARCADLKLQLLKNDAAARSAAAAATKTAAAAEAAAAAVRTAEADACARERARLSAKADARAEAAVRARERAAAEERRAWREAAVREEAQRASRAKRRAATLAAVIAKAAASAEAKAAAVVERGVVRAAAAARAQQREAEAAAAAAAAEAARAAAEEERAAGDAAAVEEETPAEPVRRRRRPAAGRPAAAAAARRGAQRRAEEGAARAAALHHALLAELGAALGADEAEVLTLKVVRELGHTLCGRSLLAVMAAGGAKALETILPSAMPCLTRRSVVDWAREEVYAQQQLERGAGCDHTFVLPLRLALWPLTHASAAQRMLEGVVAAMPALGPQAVAAWGRYRAEVAPVDAPYALLVNDGHLWEIRRRFVAHPILGLLWAAAQVLNWAGGCDGWRHVRCYGIAKGAVLRHAVPLPLLVQMGVRQHVCYATHIRAWCEGALVACYGCGDCTQYESLKKLKPRHLLLYGKSRAACATLPAPCPFSLLASLTTSLTSFRSSPLVAACPSTPSPPRAQKSTQQHCELSPRACCAIQIG